MAGKPAKLYYVLIKPGGKRLKYGQKGGGVYSNEKAATSQYNHLKEYGCNVELHIGEVNWALFKAHGGE